MENKTPQQEEKQESSVFILALKEIMLVILLCMVAVFLLFFSGFTGSSVLDIPQDNASEPAHNASIENFSIDIWENVSADLSANISLNSTGEEPAEQLNITLNSSLNTPTPLVDLNQTLPDIPQNDSGIENSSIPSIENSTASNETSAEDETNQSIVNNTADNAGLKNITGTLPESELNQSQTNTTSPVQEEIVYLVGSAIPGVVSVGAPVTWTVFIEKNNTNSSVLSAAIHSQAFNISVFRVAEIKGTGVAEGVQRVENSRVVIGNRSLLAPEEHPSEEVFSTEITGFSVAKTPSGNGLFSGIIAQLVSLFRITGSAVLDPGSVALSSPADNAAFGRNLNLIYETSRDFDGCYLNFDGLVVQQDVVVTQGVNFFELRYLDEGEHTWFITCFDRRDGFKSEAWKFIVEGINRTLPGSTENKSAEETVNQDAYDESREVVGSLFFNITEEIDSPAVYKITYQTPGPEKQEVSTGQASKLVQVSSDVHYTNIRLSSVLPVEANPEKIRLYLKSNMSRVPVDIVDYIDYDDDSLTDEISWIVPSLSVKDYEIVIEVLNVHSYPRIGGNWTVEFNTSGTADLTITPVEGTTFAEFSKDSNETIDDLMFVGLSCDGQSLTSALEAITADGSHIAYSSVSDNDSLVVVSLFIRDYSCNGTGIITNTELFGGSHALLFVFGDANATAYNYVSQISCSVLNKASCSDTHVIYISDQFNAHAELNNQSDYDWTLCCQEIYGEPVGTDCSATHAERILKLSGMTNSHIEKAAESEYGFDVCLSPTDYYNISCDYASSCTGYDTCVASISSSEQSSDTNIHIGNCTGPGSYSTRICCGTQEVESPPGIASMLLNASRIYNLSSDNLTAYPQGISDPEGEAVKMYYNWYRNNTPIAVLNLLMSQYAGITDSDETVFDISNYHNDGTLGASGGGAGDSAEPSYNRSGGFDGFGAYCFDGVNDRILISNSPSLALGDSYSVEFWFYPLDTETDELIRKSGVFEIYKSSNVIYFRTWNSTGQYTQVSSGSITGFTGSWHHAVSVFAGGNRTIYIDGTYRNSGLTENFVPSNSVSVDIGAYSTGAYPFNGTFSDIRIFNVSLNVSQVSVMYNSGIGRYNITHSDMTHVSEWWNVSGTPVDALGLNGSTVWSNNLTILGCEDKDNDGFGAIGTPDINKCSFTHAYDCDDLNASVLPPRDDLNLTSDTWLCNGTFLLNNTAASNGIINIMADGVDVYCNNTIIRGNNTGSGFFASGRSGFSIVGCNASNYTYGTYVSSGSGSTIRGNAFFNASYGIYLSGASGSLIYNNTVMNSSLYHAFSDTVGNQFNTTVTGVPGGNYWGGVDILKVYDTNSDGFGDGGIQYPYRRSNGGNVSDNVIDYGPLTFKSTYRIQPPILIQPANEELVTDSRNPVYGWNNPEHTLSDSVTYNIQVDDNSDFSSPVLFQAGIPEGSISTYYWNSTWLELGTAYYWRALANDTYNLSDWSPAGNFSILPTTSCTQPVDEIDFGNMCINPNQAICDANGWGSHINDTLDNHPPPYVLENDGNIRTKELIYSTKLWTSPSILPMPHGYYQFMILPNESSSYDWALDSAWVDMTNLSGSPILSLYGFKWQNVSDSVFLHIRLEAPTDEPAGAKYSTTHVTCEQNETY